MKNLFFHMARIFCHMKYSAWHVTQAFCGVRNFFFHATGRLRHVADGLRHMKKVIVGVTEYFSRPENGFFRMKTSSGGMKKDVAHMPRSFFRINE